MATVENENGGELYKATYRFIGTESHTIGLQGMSTKFVYVRLFFYN